MTFAGNFISGSDISTGVTGTGGGISAHVQWNKLGREQYIQRQCGNGRRRTLCCSLVCLIAVGTSVL